MNIWKDLMSEISLKSRFSVDNFLSTEYKNYNHLPKIVFLFLNLIVAVFRAMTIVCNK